MGAKANKIEAEWKYEKFKIYAQKSAHLIWLAGLLRMDGL